MKKSEEYGESRNAAYVREMVEAKKVQPRDPRFTPPKSEAQTMYETLSREEYAKWRARPITKDWLANADARNPDGTIDPAKAAPERVITSEEFMVYKGMQRREKNTVGQSEKSAFTPERREAAANAFTYSQPAQLTDKEKEKLTVMSGYTKPPVPVEEPKKSWLERLFGRFMGKKSQDDQIDARMKAVLEEAERRREK